MSLRASVSCPDSLATTPKRGGERDGAREHVSERVWSDVVRNPGT